MYNSNLPIQLEATYRQLFQAKIESQRWCLGLLGTDSLLYHDETNGVLIQNTSISNLQRNTTERFTRPSAISGGPIWMDIAAAEIGIKEVKGSQDNARVLEYLNSTGGAGTQGDETYWCAAFVNWVMKEAGFKGTNSKAARSWSNWGTASEPKYGAIVVISRGSNPAFGHVGFFVKQEGNYIILLGGNQSDSVRESRYHISRVVTYRWPSNGDKR